MMTPSNSAHIDQLWQARATLESQRALLGDAVVDVALAAIDQQIEVLEKAPNGESQQRKQATVLFTDIVGSTRLVQDLDPEDNMEIMEGGLTRLATVVRNHGGRVARYQGDGFKAVFGMPTAHEADPENAVRAGLEMIAAAQEYARHVEAVWQRTGFSIRVGIDTGLVIAGAGTEAENTVTGMVVNLAARLESAAPPGGLLISHHTYRHVRGVFDVEPQAPIRVKGFPEPIPIYLVKRAKPRTFRMNTRGVEGIETKTIGRDGELDQMRSAYRTAFDKRQTTLITIVGEAGIGKSRLLYEFDNWLELRPELIRYFKGRASQQSQRTPYHLLRDVLATRFQILSSDPVATVQQKFTAGVAEFLTDDAPEKAAVLGIWLGYDFSDSPAVQRLRNEPEQIKNRALLYLAQFFAAVGARQPVVLFLEDIHWADDRSLDAMVDVARRQPTLPLLIVCLARPSLYARRRAWGDRFPVQHRLELTTLSSAMTRALALEILRLVDNLPPGLLDLIVSRAEGNPFFVEELIRMLIDDEVIVKGTEAWHVDPAQLLELKVPSTLTSVLQARLDRLGSAEKNTLQQASVIGRTFWDEALASLFGDPQSSLLQLESKDFILPQLHSAFDQTAEYHFKHAILRDVTYGTVLKRLRRRYHALVADWLVDATVSSGRGDEYAALVGEHYQSAEKLIEAAHWYGRAGRQAAATFANDEAVHYLSLALQFTPESDRAGRFALLKIREEVHGLQGNRDANVQDLADLVALADGLDNAARATAALRQARHSQVSDQYAAAIRYAEAAIEFGQQADKDDLMAEGRWLWGDVLRQQGHYDQARAQFETGLRLAEDLGDQKRMAQFRRGLGMVARHQGDFGQARAQLEQALSIQRQIGDQHGEGGTLGNLGITADLQGDYATAKTHYAEALAIFRAIGAWGGESSALTNLGIVAVRQGEFALAQHYQTQCLALFQQVGNRRGEAKAYSNLGMVAGSQADLATARRYYEQALAIQREIGDRHGEEISLFNLGYSADCVTDRATARHYYEQALAINRDGGNKRGIGLCLSALGALAVADKHLPQAEAYLTEALAAYNAARLDRMLVDVWASLAQLRLAQNDEEGTHQHVQQVLDYVRDNPALPGSDNRMRVLHFTWRALVALDRQAEADALLAHAAHLIRQYLENISDSAIRERYLRQVHVRDVWSAWTASDDGGNVATL